MIPESQKTHTDLIDILVEASQTIEEVPQADGTVQKQLLLDPETLWWKTGIINSPFYGRFAFELKEWERQGPECYDNMCKDRAYEISKDIMDIGKSYRRSMDAKSSESLIDRDKTCSTLIDKINKNKIERSYKLTGDGMKKTFMDDLLNRDRERDEE